MTIILNKKLEYGIDTAVLECNLRALFIQVNKLVQKYSCGH